MSITLEESKIGMRDAVAEQVVDEFRRSSFLLDSLVFDNAVAKGGSGSTLVYGYVQIASPSTVAVRTINTEYTPGEAKRKELTSKIVVFGGSFEVDRVLAGTSGAIDEINFQLQQKVKASANYFHNLVINGTRAATGTGFVVDTFDGLNKLLAGKETEITSLVDLSTPALIDANYNAFLDELDQFIGMLDGKPSMLLMNDKMLTKVRGIGRRAGYYSREENAFGVPVEKYNNIPLVDVGKYYNGTATVDVIPNSTPTSSLEGKTDIYAITIGLDGFHGISPTGTNLVNTYLPDMKSPGAVKTGEVEMLAGVVLKNTRKAGVLRGIKIAPKTV